MQDLSVLRLNVDKGMLNYEKLMAIKQFCKKSDVVLLQETCGYNKETLWKKYLGRKGKFSLYQANEARGVASLCNEKFGKADSEGRVTSILVSYQNMNVIKKYLTSTV